MRRVTSALSFDFGETLKLSAVLKTRHGLLKLPNLIDIALFSITTLSAGPAGSWQGSLVSSCDCHRFAGTCSVDFFHKLLEMAHENFHRGP